jgi:hypothetical protein
MLSRPFRGLPKRRLVTLLILFLLLEAALGGGLYVNNRPVNASQPIQQLTRQPSYRGPVVLKVQNTPRTVILGHEETFSVQLKGLKRVILTYTVAYPDGSTDSKKVLTDNTGYSKVKFLINFRPQHGNRDSIGIGVSYANKLQASTRFAVQLPDTKK